MRKFSLKVLQENPKFKVYELPKQVQKRKFMELNECYQAPQPISSAFRPYVFESPKLGTKKYFWCACGLSRKQPFCDSSHIGTAFKPVTFYIEENVSKVYLCLCKHTSSPPYCDGNSCKKD